MITLQDEYKTLRDEVLQLYKDQLQLAFVTAASAIAAMLAFFAQRGSDLNPWLWLSGILLLLIGVTQKIRANYFRIFCIGSYLSVMYERRGLSDAGEIAALVADVDRPGWHTRWRLIDERAGPHRGRLGRAGAASDAMFIFAVALAAWFTCVGPRIGGTLEWVLKSGTLPTPEPIDGIAIACGTGLSCLLLYLLWRLRNIQNDALFYRNAFAEMLRCKPESVPSQAVPTSATPA